MKNMKSNAKMRSILAILAIALVFTMTVVGCKNDTTNGGSSGGNSSSSSKYTCVSCKGSGRCNWCKGSGYVGGKKCTWCHGNGICSICNGKGYKTSYITTQRSIILCANNLDRGYIGFAENLRDTRNKSFDLSKGQEITLIRTARALN